MAASSFDGLLQNRTEVEGLPSVLVLAKGHRGPSRSMVLWPIILNAVLLGSIGLYLIFISPILVRAMGTGRWYRPFSLRSGKASSQPRRTAHPHPSLFAKAHATCRGLYNSYLLPTVPLVDLTVGQCMVLCLYFVFVTVSTFVGARGRDLLDRSGRIAVAQTPILFALATKNSILGLFGKTYERLNFIHRFSGRCIFVGSIIHSAGYLKRAVDRRRRLDQWNKQSTGLMAFICLVVLVFTSFRIVRRYAYRLFLVCHILGWILYLVALYCHVPYCQPWVIASFAIIGADFIVRIATTRVKTARVVARPGRITEISVEDIRSGWKAGQHVWVRRMVGRHMLEPHPFTIANSAEYDTLMSDSRGLVLYAKDCGDWTRSLHAHASGKSIEDASPPAEQTLKCSIEGPYGASYYEPCTMESLLLVAGGSGITYVLSVLEDLIATGTGEPASCTTRRVLVVFTAQDMSSNVHFVEDLEVLVEEARSRCSNVRVDVRLFHTASADTNVGDLLPTKELAVDMRSSLTRGRPDLGALLEDLCMDTKSDLASRGQEIGGSVLVATCGPAGLIDAARRAAKSVDRDLAYRVGGIIVQSEHFGW